MAFRRTPKIMTVVSSCIPILDQSWFEDSADAGMPLKEESYIVQVMKRPKVSP